MGAAFILPFECLIIYSKFPKQRTGVLDQTYFPAILPLRVDMHSVHIIHIVNIHNPFVWARPNSPVGVAP
jgi:hypothetical protein